MWDGIERRRFSRVQYPCLITVRKTTVAPFAILTHTVNLGLGGIRVKIVQQIKIATEVDIEIDLKDTMPNMLSKGTVTWVKSFLDAEDPRTSGEAGTSQPIKGKVAWVKKIPATKEGKPALYDTGIQFIGLKKDDCRRIEGIVIYFKKRKRGGV